MLKNLGYYGAYRDPYISVDVLLENPLHCGMDPSKLVFSVIVKSNPESAENFRFEDCTFYLMDEQDRLYNTGKAPGAQPDIGAAEEEAAVLRSDGLIFADFRPEFLFQDLCIVFYRKDCRQFYRIELKS